MVMGRICLKNVRAGPACSGSAQKSLAWPVILLSLWLGSVVAQTTTKDEQTYYFFDIPSQGASNALITLGKQADVTVLYRFDLVKNIITNAVLGKYSLSKAVSLLLADSGLHAEFDTGGNLVIRTANSVEGNQTTINSEKRKRFSGLASATTGDAAAQSRAVIDIEAIIVTGSRLKRSGYDAPTPVSVITADEIRKATPVTISDFVNQMPALAGSHTLRTTRGLVSDGLSGGNFLNLRNIDLPRTLVLMNGRRVTPSTLSGTVDVNTIPSALVSRVDIVTGGASAAWGADAVAGVVNFVLDQKYKGLKGSVQGGMATEGDAENFAADLSFGKGFADGRGHMLLSGQYNNVSKAMYSDRDWFKGYKVVPNPDAGTPNEASLLAAPWSTVFANSTGLIASGPLAGYYFDENGNLAGTDFPLASKTSVYSAGDKAIYKRLADQSLYNFASQPMEQKSLFGRISFEVANSTILFVEGSYAESKTSAGIANYWRVGNTTVAVDNFYLPEQVRQAVVANDLNSIPLSISYTKMGVIKNKVKRDNFRTLVGMEGEFGSTWKWDASYQYGRSNTNNRAYEMPRPGQHAEAIDAVANPSNPAEPICRSSLTNPDNGCIPMNPFGSAPLSAEVLANVTGTSMQDIKYEQSVAAANISGDVLALPAGVLSLAAGVEYREEKAVAGADPISEVNGFWAGNFKDFSGKYDVKEVYAELGVPVVQESAIGSLDLNFAGRLTDYSTSGLVETWKAGFRYEPTGGAVLRLTRSRNIRAPNLQELYTPGVVTNQAVVDPFHDNDSIRMVETLSGNLDLDPEMADTWTVGVVLQPTFAPRLRASIDYYDITIKDAIATNSSQFIIDRCFEGLQVFCPAITRDPVTDTITAVNLKPFNALREDASGADTEVSYTTEVGGGNLDLRVLASYVDKLEIVTPDTVITRAGEVGNNVGAAEGVPHWRWFASAAYDRDPWTVQLKGRLIGKAKVDDAWEGVIDRNRVPSVFYLDVYTALKTVGLISGGEFFLAVDNILNKDPPIVTPLDNSNSLAAGTNLFIYDVLGTTVRVGFRFEL